MYDTMRIYDMHSFIPIPLSTSGPSRYRIITPEPVILPVHSIV